MSVSQLPPVADGTINTSFAFISITKRWPKIITKIIDQLHQYFKEASKLYGEDGEKDVKQIISQLAELQYSIVTDKPLKKIAKGSDSDIWNNELDNYCKELGESNITWFKLPWLFVECFLYRKIFETFLSTIYFQNYDPFNIEKQNSYFNSYVHIIGIGTDLVNIIEKKLDSIELRISLLRLLQIALWGNRCDLSLSGSDPHFLSDTIFKELVELESNILVNDLEEVCDNFILNKSVSKIDIILDNAGLEVFTDLCLADFLISKSLTKKVVFHGKSFPWFVSDTTKSDFDWIIEQLTLSNDFVLNKLGVRWTNFVNNNKFEFKSHAFWTYGYSYFEMRKRAIDLYEELSASDLIIFKGDLNYRKLVGDRYWPLSTNFKKALCGFEPTTFLSLRTLKAETVVGLSAETIKNIEKKFGKENKSWMVIGEYAVAQIFVN